MASPIAIDDFFILSENQTVTGNLFANNSPNALFDYDPDADTFVVVGVSTSASVGVDPSSVDADYYLDTSGFVHVEADGDFTLDWGSAAPGNALGLDETMPAVFFYMISDGNGGFDTATVTYTIVSTSQTHNGDGSAGDNINAGLGNDVVNGFGGGDTLDGGAGVDILNGGAGNDTLRADANLSNGETFSGGLGIDTVEFVKAASSPLSLTLYSQSFISIERLVIASGGTAGSADLSLHASQFGGPRLSSTLTLVGNALVTESVVIELADTPGATFSMAGFSFVDWSGGDTIYLNGTTGSETLIGSSMRDTIGGGAGNDVINGGGGGDFMDGGADNDTYTVDNADDFIADSSGIDTVNASLNWTLAAYLENLTLLTGAVNGVGNASANIITGNGAANTLTGFGGADTLSGGNGADILNGGAAQDTLIGGVGKDTMTGGTSADKFVFNVAVSAVNADVITDFTAGVDKIQLDNDVFTALGAATGGLGPKKFWVGASAHDANDFIVYNAGSGKLFYDADGNGSGAAILIATLTGAPALSASDIQII